MRIMIQALIEGTGGDEPRAEAIGVINRGPDGAPASGLGLFLRETHAMLRKVQAVVLREQAAQFVERASHWELLETLASRHDGGRGNRRRGSEG